MEAVGNGGTGMEYLRRLAEEARIEDPADEQLRRFDKKRRDQ